jgi:hypothetical protein
VRESERHCVRRAFAKRPKAEETDFAALEPLLLEHVMSHGKCTGAAYSLFDVLDFCTVRARRPRTGSSTTRS